MANLIESVKSAITAQSAEKTQAVAQECNYQDNYYGDQYCKPCEDSANN